MSRRQRNPNREDLSVSEQLAHLEAKASSRLAPSRPPSPDLKKAARQTTDDVKATSRPNEPGDDSWDKSPKGMDRLGLFIALQSEDINSLHPKALAQDPGKAAAPSGTSVKQKESPQATRLARDQRRQKIRSPKLPKAESLPKVSPRVESSPVSEEVRTEEPRNRVLPKTPRSVTSGISAKTKAPQHERRPQGVCMKGTGDWEPVIAKIDDSSKQSLLNPATANLLGLTLHPIPRRKANKIALSNSSKPSPQFWASNVGLRSVSVDIPLAYIDIMVGPVSCEQEHVELIIGRRLLHLLKTRAKQAAAEKPGPGLAILRDFETNAGSGTESLVSKQEGEVPLPPRSSSTTSETFSAGCPEYTLSPFTGQYPSVYDGERTYKPLIGDLAADPRSFSIEEDVLVGCGESF